MVKNPKKSIIVGEAENPFGDEADNDYYIKAKTAQEFNKLEPIAQGIIDRLDILIEIQRGTKK